MVGCDDDGDDHPAALAADPDRRYRDRCRGRDDRGRRRGRVFVHGNLSFAWDAGDTAGRRFAAVSLMRIKAATQVQVAAAFDTSPLTVWRWAQALSAAGVSALVPHLKGPR